MYIDKLDDIVNKYSSTHHSTIKIKPVDVKSNIYNGFDVEQNDEGLKFEVGDYLRILKCKKTLQIGLKKFWWLKEIKNTVL